MNVEEVLNRIYIEIKDKNVKNSGLLGGDLGFLLFLYEYYKYCRHENIVEGIQSKLDKTLQGMRHDIWTFCNGISGLGWVLQYFKNEGFIEGEIDGVTSRMDELFYKSFYREESKMNLDFLHGSLGIAYYLAFRENEFFSKSTEAYLKIIEETSINTQTGNIAWVSSDFSGVSVYNLGLSHGIPSILAYILKIYQRGIFKERIIILIKKIIGFLLESRNPENFKSNFSSMINIENKNYRESRLAWCYGDIGTAYTLYRASLIVHDNELSATVLQMLKETTLRRNPVTEGVRDASFCHGSSGIMHVYNRLYNHTKEYIFKDAANYWLQITLSKANLSDRYPIYQYYHAKDNVWVENYSVLEGSAGIGLALLSMISEDEPSWDSCLLLS